MAGDDRPPVIYQEFREGLTLEAEAWTEHASFYHKPTEAAGLAHKAVNTACMANLRVILLSCPPSPDRTHALNHVRQARMWANSAIALEGAPPMQPHRAERESYPSRVETEV